MMHLTHILLPLLLSLLLNQAAPLSLQKDIEKDQQVLTKTFVYINDNTSLSPSVETVLHDLQLFQVVGNISVLGAEHSTRQQGKHKIHKWQFPEGSIKAIYQIESNIALDTVVTQRYLENRAPTQQRIKNNFIFRTYVVSTQSNASKLFYLTEAEQGLLEYRISDKKVEIGYSEKKNGLIDLLPSYIADINRLLNTL